MSELEHREFLLCCRVKSWFLQCISDGLGSDRIRDDGINELHSLNCVIKLSRTDLVDNWLIVTSSKFRRATSRMVLLAPFHFLTNPPYSTLPQTSSRLNLMMRIPLIEEKNNRRALSSGNGFNDGGMKLRWLNQFQHVKLIQTWSHDIVYCSLIFFCLLLEHKNGNSGEIT